MSNKDKSPVVVVIMSIYINDILDHVENAIKSILDQSYKNIKLFICIDGPISKDLLLHINNLNKSGKIYKVIVLKKNMGLAYALNEIIKVILSMNIDYIARMDSDDISNLDRIKKQVEFLEINKDVDVVGGYISEFGSNQGIIRYPLTHNQMLKYFSKRNPIGHVTVMFRTSFFKKAGLYPMDTLRNEDTLLWLNGFKFGCKFANIPEVMVNVRVDNMFLKRRHTFPKILGDVKDRILIVRQLKLGIIGIFYSISYFILMLLPVCLNRSVIEYFRKHSKISNVINYV